MYTDWLIKAGMNQPCFSGNPHPLLMQLAEDHANFMASHNQQGHQNFRARYDRIYLTIKCRATEICAESWPWDKSMEDISNEMFKLWSQSPGHWHVVKTPHTYFGAAMAEGKRVWYACILVADA